MPAVCLIEQEDRETLRDQMSAAPAEGDPNDMAINVAKIRDMEARLLEEREEKASLMAEKQALQARLAKLKDAGTGELREKAELQEALVRSEEQRLEVSRALIDFQMEFNECKQEFENQKFHLEQRILELEGAKLEHYVRQEDHAALNDVTDRLNTQLKEAREDFERARKAQLAAEDAAAEAIKEVRRLNQLMAALESAGQGDASALMEGGDGSDLPSAPSGQQQAGQKLNMLELRQQLQTQLKYKERRIQELESQLAEVMQREERMRQLRSVNQESLDQARNIFRRKMEGAARELADVTRVAALGASDSNSTLRIGPEEVAQRLLRFIEQTLQVSEERQAELKRDAEELAARHAELKRRFRMLYGGYRALRYRIEDEWPVAAGAAMRVAHEDTVIAGSMEDLLRNDEDTDRKAAGHLRERLSKMEAEMGQLKVEKLEWDTGLGINSSSSNSNGRDARGGMSTSYGDRAASAHYTTHTHTHDGGSGANSAVMLENARLREEMDRLKRSVVSGRRGSVDEAMGMAAELTELRAENERLRAAGTSGSSAEGPPAGSNNSDGLRKQLKEFTINTQLDLERKVQGAESRAVMAEEQLAQLQRYIAQASITYQREIMRLRGVVSKLDPTGTALRSMGAGGGGLAATMPGQGGSMGFK